MIHGNDGALVYTHWGENFSVHKVGGSSGFEYGEDDIMEIERYEMASDVSLDVLGNIYVADTGHDRIQQFNPSGRFTFNIGMNRVLVDSTYSDSILVGSEYEYITRDTTYLVEVADILDGPRSVAVDATGVVYIADTKHQRVMRYRLSTELDYTTEE
jgi:DNA-binding beta-propeller fold protein YncE